MCWGRSHRLAYATNINSITVSLITCITITCCSMLYDERLIKRILEIILIYYITKYKYLNYKSKYT